MVEPAQLILGSASPRRADLLRDAGISFEVRTASVDEDTVAQGLRTPGEIVERIARAKFDATQAVVATTSTLPILAADTMVVSGDRILGKPRDAQDLTGMLEAMSASTVTVYTATCFGAAGDPRCEIVTTDVRLRTLEPSEIDDYVASGAGFDKAGGLALQSEAAPFMQQVDGCWSNVVGLPVCSVSAALAGANDRADRCTTDLCGGPPR